MTSVNASSAGYATDGADPVVPFVVRLEVRNGTATPTFLHVPETGFLLGSVPGCDLRLPGTNLPPVLALLTLSPTGPLLRKLIPTCPLLKNGRPAVTGPLVNGDRLTVGQVHIVVQVTEPEALARDSVALANASGSVMLRQEQKSHAEYQADLIHLHRREAALEDRLQDVQRREQTLAQDQEQVRLQQASLTERSQQVERAEVRVREEEERLRRESAELTAALGELGQRSNAFEGQQAVLTALRTRLERLRDDLRDEAQQLAEQRTRQTTAETELQTRLQEVERLRAELAAESQVREEERRQFAERSVVMEEALAQFRQVQANLEAEEERLRQRQQLLNAAADQQAEEASILAAKATQLVALQQRLAADRQTLREREQALTQAEQVREALQEQLRRRSEDLAARQQQLTEQARSHEEQIAAIEHRRAEIEHERRASEEQIVQLRRQLDTQAADLDQQRADLAARQAALKQQRSRLQEMGRKLGAARKVFQAARVQWQAEQRQTADADAQRQTELETLRQETLALQEQLPELELRGQAAQERLAAAREQLREHLAELHSYAQQGRQDLEALQTQVQAEAERVRQQDAALGRTREEHRLAVASFRQQLIVWQGQLGEMRRSLVHDETRLERRAAKVEQKTRQIDAASAELSQRSEQVAEQERLAAERRSEMERHLDDMREWYRRKLRELALGKDEGGRMKDEGKAEDPKTSSSSFILYPSSFEPEPGDQQLGGLLQKMELVDRETLKTLLAEAQRQRRSLRQLLLAGSHLTLYQMALIEAGNLDALMLGPVRVIDRLRATAHETVYRVFDPRRGEEAILRHLSEADAEDAVRPDEFRQRFAQAATVRHPNVAATWEVLEVAGRPAVLQEAFDGLPATDWPAFTDVSGVWYRLLHRTALGLRAAHEAGVTHDHLQLSSLVLTDEGVLKVCGFGEPPWLGTPPAPGAEDDASGDLAALGRLASSWAIPSPRRNAKSLAEALAGVLQRLTTDNPELRYPDLAALVEGLERIGPEVPDAGAAWKRFLRAIHEQADEDELRQSA